MAIETTEVKAARTLRTVQPVRHISVFGERLLADGVLRRIDPAMRYTRQGLALLAGKWLRRMERQGLARNGLDGWVAAEMPPNEQ